MSRRRASRPTLAQRADRFRLYEASVQTPHLECVFLESTFRELRGRAPQRLREDFCGTGALAAEWVKRGPRRTAIGVDLDPTPLAWGTERHLLRMAPSRRKRVRLLEDDVLRAHTESADIVVALNFSYWVFAERPRLLAYFKAARRALARDGLLVLDAFGGPDAYRMMRDVTEYRGFTYVWRQADYDPIGSRYTCHIDFRFPDGSRLSRAFTYHWRLWTLPEIRELLQEAGFRRSKVYLQGHDDSGEPDDAFEPAERGPPERTWLAYVVAVR